MYYIGIDLGGTNVRAALVNEDGQILSQIIESTEVEKGPNYIINKICRMIRSLDGFEKAKAIGVGAPGPLDPYKGIILSPVNLPDWDEIHLSDILTNEFGIPTFVDNDANVAGLAEAILGSGRGYSIVQYITISTGIGGGLIIDGKIINGATGNAGEIANIIVQPGGYKHSILNPGALEGMASGTAIKRIGKERLKAIEDAKDVFRLAGEGNEEAIRIIDEVVDYLARGIAAISHVVEPHIFVIGGGVMKSKEYFLSKLRKRAKDYVYDVMKDNLKISEAKLDNPGVIGAAMLAKTKIEILKK